MLYAVLKHCYRVAGGWKVTTKGILSYGIFLLANVFLLSPEWQCNSLPSHSEYPPVSAFQELINQTNGEFSEKFEERELQLVVNMPREPVIIEADGWTIQARFPPCFLPRRRG